MTQLLHPIPLQTLPFSATALMAITQSYYHGFSFLCLSSLGFFCSYSRLVICFDFKKTALLLCQLSLLQLCTLTLHYPSTCHLPATFKVHVTSVSSFQNKHLVLHFSTLFSGINAANKMYQHILILFPLCTLK